MCNLTFLQTIFFTYNSYQSVNKIKYNTNVLDQRRSNGRGDSLKKISKKSSLLPSSRQTNNSFLQSAILDEAIVISDDEVVVISDDEVVVISDDEEKVVPGDGDNNQQSGSRLKKQSNRQAPDSMTPAPAYSNNANYFNLRVDDRSSHRDNAAKSQVLKCFNESTVFTAKRIADLINKSGMSFDEIKYWHDCIVASINAFYEKFPNPCAEDFMLESTFSGVEVKILKNWSDVKKRVGISENVKREVLELTKVPTTIRVDFSGGTTFPSKKENCLLEAFHLRNPTPCKKTKRKISRLLECEVDKIEEWFVNKNRLPENLNKNKKTNYYEIAARELEAGLSLEENDVRAWGFPCKTTSNTFTTSDVEFLKDFFYHDPYPSKKMVVWVCHKLEHTFGQVHGWFFKMRKKVRSKYSKINRSLL